LVRLNPERAGEPEEIADEIIASVSLTRLREYLLVHLILDRTPDNGECESDAMGALTLAHHDVDRAVERSPLSSFAAIEAN